LVFLFFALASLYYYKERQRYFQEQKVENKLDFAECKHLKKMLPSAPECKMFPVVIDDKLRIVYTEIFYAFLLALVLILPFSYFLARLSLRPMREAVSAMDGFINGIVHDINTPLSVIRMNAQSITKAVKDEKIKIKASRLLQGVTGRIS
jgi:signal transduction histidine kinase